MNTPIVALLTDFGRDFAVAALEAIVLRQVPHARVIHVDHSIEKFNVVSAAFVLEQSYRIFPKGTVFVGVVDPGVGSERAALCIEYEGYIFIGPDNGIFHTILKNPDACIYQIDEAIISPASSTFHGRDIFIPAACAYLNGKRDFCKKIDSWVSLPELDDTSLIVYIDSFGNIKTNVTYPNFPKDTHISIKHNNIQYSARVVTTFSDVQKGELILYKGSNNTIEIAVVKESAQVALTAHVWQSI